MIMTCGCWQAYGAEARPEEADQPMEEAGMSDEVLQKLQDKATLLTAERKKVTHLDKQSWLTEIIYKTTVYRKVFVHFR